VKNLSSLNVIQNQAQKEIDKIEEITKINADKELYLH
jgi:hypothetical protein